MSYPRSVFVLDYFDSDSLLQIASYVLRNLPLLWTRLNGIDLDSDSPSSFGGKCCPSDHGAKEMKMLNTRIAELESKIMELEKDRQLPDLRCSSSAGRPTAVLIY